LAARRYGSGGANSICQKSSAGSLNATPQTLAPSAPFAEIANEADSGFAARLENAQGEDFVRRKFVARKNACPVPAQNERVRFFGKDPA